MNKEKLSETITQNNLNLIYRTLRTHVKLRKLLNASLVRKMITVP